MEQNVNKIKPYELILQKELMDLDVIEGVELSPVDEKNLKEIYLSIKPTDGYLKNKKFRFVIKFKESYPITPPKIICLSKIFHPNIDESGNVCLNVLKLEWNPIINLQMLILGLILLLDEPSTDDPFNKIAAEVFKNDIYKFQEINDALYKEEQQNNE
ncbi:putative NEDD8-conjugating enzyme UBC12 [Plasmodium gaboni]|uniref:Putative NEDD8-conjugating enzyme UBC12 n=1 Tax=Plasmodium gaboni TaxID=647221 RepID=A0A151LGZ7_9APIC|nr:putative NEDD8-conjugating enzyme UBC12 [Plasmodium gaboni]XP_028539611.1 NEDD8-conjugating enzyme UBC12, putative [Plasmodium sp. gorilla clade G2]KYN98234.1 putative NEDD8-conjugating enzyme UBC12 [Plasmodium gaboni]SOV17094.1 NEDD8-conjugating enzyme UBC12, putative [Plasmodium sp. gorilla clade G2]SOV23988.1 NEDD8-conjugating enzyme UBC12, putative [Plasmodium sp. DRC-Itaito]